MILGLVLVVAALMIYFNFIKPAYEENQLIKSQQLGNSLFLQQEQEAIKRVQDLISIYQEQSMVQDAISAAIPEKEDANGALAQIYGAARNSSVSLESISVSGVSLRSPKKKKPS